ncbi:MAG: hypothetical protein ACJ748_12955 [Flavisolibacter sp.]
MKCLLIFLFSALFSIYCDAQITIELRKSFIDSFRNKITIETDYQIFYAHKSPNPGSKDGDLHFAGYSSTIGLSMVAEIMNAKDQKKGVQLVHQKEGKGEPSEMIHLRGVWRIWCEHPGETQGFLQGANDISIENTNPPHVFEIHPVLQLDDIDVSSSLKGITGFSYKDAQDAFNRYSNIRCLLIDHDPFVRIETNGIGYNYVDFWLQPNSLQFEQVDDGLFAFCTIYDSKFVPANGDEDNLILHKLRVAFVRDSPAYNKLISLKKGQYLHVVGIPRIDLNLVRWRMDHAHDRPEVLQWNLPIEMVAVAILSNSTTNTNSHAHSNN